MTNKLVALVCSTFFVVFGGFLAANAAPGGLDPSFSSDGKVTDGVGKSGADNPYATALQADGKIVVAGDVSYGNYVACGVTRYTANGVLDTAFDYDGKVFVIVANAQFYCRDAVIQPDGKIVVAGYASFPGANTDFIVSRLNSNGSPDTSFDGDGNAITPVGNGYDNAQAVALQSDGKIVVAGESTGANIGDTDFALVRYNPDGSLDTTFDVDGKVTTAIGNSIDGIYDIAIQQDGKIVAVGISDTSNNNIAIRYNANGSVDPTFNIENTMLPPGTAEHAYSVTIQPNGKIVIAGSVNNGAGGDISVCRYNTNGSLDTSFDVDGKLTTSISDLFDFGNSVVVQPDGKLLVGAYYSISLGNGGFVIVRYNTNGSLDTSFDGDGIRTLTIPGSAIGSASSVILQPDNRIVALSPSSPTGLLYDFAMIRLNGNGALDTAFNNTGIVVTEVGNLPSTANATVIQADGKIVVAGTSVATTTPGGGIGATDFSIVRYDPNGLLDTTFGVSGRVLTPILNGNDVVNGTAIQPDGKIVVVGSANNGTNEDFALARYNPNGTIDRTFGTAGGILSLAIGNGDDVAKAVAIQPDGKIVVVGYAHNGTANASDFAVVRYTANGLFDTSFDSDGIVTTHFAISDNCNAVALQPDGKIVAVGSAGNGADFLLVRYNTNGSLDTSFDGDGIVSTGFEQGSFDTANAVALQPDGKIVAAGRSQGRFFLTRYNANGSLDTLLDGDGKIVTDVGPFGDVANAVSVRPNGAIIAAGVASENVFGNVNNFALTRYTANGALDPTFGGDGIAVFDFEGGSNDVLSAMAIDSNGKAVVAGTSNGLFAAARVLTGSVPLFDFDGDGKTDVGIFRPNVGEWWYLRSSSSLISALQFGSSTDLTVPADFTGDGKTDITFFRPSSGEWFVLRSEDNSYFAFHWGSNGDIPAPADYDGDGKADAAVFRPSLATWFIFRSSDGGVTTAPFGIAEDKPVVADFDGDGRADIAIYRPSNSQWWISRSGSGSVSAVQFGQPGDKTVPGDYTGDGKADLAFWRPSSGQWFIVRSEDSSFFAFPFGLNGDVAAPGDYDGDGRMDSAVFRPSNRVWYLNRSTSGIAAVQFGLATDVPVPSVFNRP